MKMRKRMEKRMALGWLLLGLILAPAVAILVWLLILKAPPGNAVLILDAIPAGQVLATPAAGQIATPTQEARLFAIASKEAVSAQTALLKQTPMPSGTNLPVSVQLPGVSSPTIESITVYVSGAVVSPGVYTLPSGSRVRDAINDAGGVTISADLNTINLAGHIEDEDHIIVPEKGATPIVATATPLHPIARQSPQLPGEAKRSPTAKTQSNPARKIDINTATQVELEEIPGVGPVLAARIVAFREDHGHFASIEDVVVVPGIKEGLLAKMRDFITATP